MKHISKFEALKVISIGFLVSILTYIVLSMSLDVRRILVIVEQVYKYQYKDCSETEKDCGVWL